MEKEISPNEPGLSPDFSDPGQRGTGKAWILFCMLAAIALVLDQGTKWIALFNLDPMNPQTIIPGLFELRLVYNDGAAFSLFRGARWMFVLVSIGATIFLPWYLRSLLREGEDHWLYPVGLGMILGGALGNAIDRIFRSNGHVVDFFHFFWNTHSFPVFNVADSAITVGLFALIWSTLFVGGTQNSSVEDPEEHVSNSV